MNEIISIYFLFIDYIFIFDKARLVHNIFQSSASMKKRFTSQSTSHRQHINELTQSKKKSNNVKIEHVNLEKNEIKDQSSQWSKT